MLRCFGFFAVAAVVLIACGKSGSSTSTAVEQRHIVLKSGPKAAVGFVAPAGWSAIQGLPDTTGAFRSRDGASSIIVRVSPVRGAFGVAQMVRVAKSRVGAVSGDAACGADGRRFDASASSNGRTYLSHWAISAHHGQLTIAAYNRPDGTNAERAAVAFVDATCR